MNKPIRVMLKDPTAKCLTEGATAFVIPWKEQPPEDYKYDGLLHGLPRFFSRKAICYVTPEPPYKPGHPLYLLETWGLWCDRYVYKAGYAHIGLNRIRKELTMMFGSWRSPATMPNIACRRVWKDWTIEGIQLETIKSPYNQRRERLKMTGGIEYWLEDTYPGLTMNSWVWLINLTKERHND